MPLFLHGVDSNSRTIGFSCRIRGSDKVPFILRVPVPNDTAREYGEVIELKKRFKAIKVKSSHADNWMVGTRSWCTGGLLVRAANLL